MYDTSISHKYHVKFRFKETNLVKQWAICSHNYIPTSPAYHLYSFDRDESIAIKVLNSAVWLKCKYSEYSLVVSDDDIYKPFQQYHGKMYIPSQNSVIYDIFKHI
jgi:hypothetical protein